MAQKVDIWVDPACPYAWMTAQWMLEVEKVRDVETQFNVMSLSVLNEGREELSDDYKAMLSRGWGPVRLLTAVEQEHGKQALRDVYLALGTARHNNQRELGPDVYVEALEKAGLDSSLAEKADDASLDEALRKSHHAGMDAVGQEVGTPVIHFPREDGTTSAFFGPVIVPPPTGDEAGRLWDGMLLVASTDGLYEVKRTRDRSPEFLPMP